MRCGRGSVVCAEAPSAWRPNTREQVDGAMSLANCRTRAHRPQKRELREKARGVRERRPARRVVFELLSLGRKNEMGSRRERQAKVRLSLVRLPAGLGAQSRVSQRLACSFLLVTTTQWDEMLKGMEVMEWNAGKLVSAFGRRSDVVSTCCARLNLKLPVGCASSLQ